MRSTYVMRVWLPDRPGALGAVASRIGAVGGDVVGIDIVERGAGLAVDDLVVELPSAELLDLLVSEVRQVDGVDVEDLRPVTEALRDPRLDALETAAVLVGATSATELVEAVCEHGARTVGATWGAVIDLAEESVLSDLGERPPLAWLVAFVRGTQASSCGGPVLHADPAAVEVVWAPLPAAGLTLVLGREGHPFRARERRQVMALARIVDTRLRQLRAVEARRGHPSAAGR
jgi:hypothetical protein